jgi:hypothetical protein
VEGCSCGDGRSRLACPVFVEAPSEAEGKPKGPCGPGVPGRCRATNLSHPHIQHRQPILKRLQSKATKDEHNPKSSQPPLRKIVRDILDQGNNRAADAGNNPNHQPDANRKQPSMLNVLHKSATQKCRSGIAKRSRQDRPCVAPGNTRPSSSGIVKRRTNPANVSNDLPHRNQNGERPGKFPSQIPVKRRPERKSPDRAEQILPTPTNSVPVPEPPD